MAYNPLVPGGRYGVHTFVENGRAMKQTCTGSVCTHEDHLKGMRKPTVPQQLPFGDPSLVNSLDRATKYEHPFVAQNPNVLFVTGPPGTVGARMYRGNDVDRDAANMFAGVEQEPPGAVNNRHRRALNGTRSGTGWRDDNPVNPASVSDVAYHAPVENPGPGGFPGPDRVYGYGPAAGPFRTGMSYHPPGEDRLLLPALKYRNFGGDPSKIVNGSPMSGGHSYGPVYPNEQPQYGQSHFK